MGARNAMVILTIAYAIVVVIDAACTWWPA